MGKKKKGGQNLEGTQPDYQNIYVKPGGLGGCIFFDKSSPNRCAFYTVTSNNHLKKTLISILNNYH